MDLQRAALLCTIFCFAQVWTMPTHCGLQRHLVKMSYAHLQALSGLFPLECLPDLVSIDFPQNVFLTNGSQDDAAVEKTLYKTLLNIDELLKNDSVPEQWDEESLDHFRMIMHRQVEDGKCVLQKPEGPDWFLGRDAALQLYFQTVSNVLQLKNYSFCAWEIARKEALHVLELVLTQNADLLR